ncbi:MAG TPA: NUDIX domain-containing protein [Mycobacteriales bacterium]|jgi:ADP-ribose pyrophosphatase YjhB (NUDIX family)|nr:NUDIX domain-containing protein [Mycobacteriales bacterium]
MKKAAFEAFRRLPGPVRRATVHAVAPSFTVGAVAVLRRPDGRVVFVDQRHSGGWALPGGLLRRGEPAAEALVREVCEEIGVDLHATRLPVPLAAVSAQVRRVDVVFVVDVPDTVAVRAADATEVRGVEWFDLSALPDVTEPTLEILRAVRLL